MPGYFYESVCQNTFQFFGVSVELLHELIISSLFHLRDNYSLYISDRNIEVIDIVFRNAIDILINLKIISYFSNFCT